MTGGQGWVLEWLDARPGEYHSWYQPADWQGQVMRWLAVEIYKISGLVGWLAAGLGLLGLVLACWWVGWVLTQLAVESCLFQG